jgi:hypothetical protein
MPMQADKHYATTGIACGIGSMGVSWVLPHVAPDIPLISSWCIFFTGIALVVLSVTGLIWPHWFQRTRVRAPAQASDSAETHDMKEDVIAAKKYYSAKDKEGLAEALYDLWEILDKREGAAIVEPMEQIISAWRRDRVTTMLETESLLLKLENVGQETAAFNRAIFYNGLLKKHSYYADELSEILLRDKNATSNNAYTDSLQRLGGLQTGINQFRDGLERVKATFKHNDPQTTSHMVGTAGAEACFDSFRKFHGWLQESGKRLKEKQASLAS